MFLCVEGVPVMVAPLISIMVDPRVKDIVDVIPKFDSKILIVGRGGHRGLLPGIENLGYGGGQWGP